MLSFSKKSTLTAFLKFAAKAIVGSKNVSSNTIGNSLRKSPFIKITSLTNGTFQMLLK